MIWYKDIINLFEKFLKHYYSNTIHWMHENLPLGYDSYIQILGDSS